MEPGREALYLRSRRGFVRMALQHGAPLVPVFAFGQSSHYGYLRLFIDWPRKLVPRAHAARFMRLAGYVPMLIWGRMGLPMPRRVPLRIVVGRPIAVPRCGHPTARQVDLLLSRFVEEMEALFERHKAAAGQPHGKLTIH